MEKMILSTVGVKSSVLKGVIFSLSDLDFAKRLGLIYDEILSLRKDSDYAVNQPQMDKFIEVLKFYMDAASDLDGSVDQVDISPAHEHGGVTATFIVFDLFGDQVQRFCSVMSACSALSIDVAEGDRVCISCTVPNVFLRKEDI